jgi:hypothetical protein
LTKSILLTAVIRRKPSPGDRAKEAKERFKARTGLDPDAVEVATKKGPASAAERQPKPPR